MAILAIAAALMVAEPAAASDAAPVELTQAERSQLQQSLNRGSKLYRYDQSAWHVTDAALAALPDAVGRHIRGYVTTPAANGLKTIFFGEGKNGPYALYSAVWTGSAIEGEKIYPADQRIPLNAEERRLIDARRIALDSAGTLTMCNSARPNVIVVPGETPDQPVSVYIMTPQTKNDSYPFGGHHRIDVKANRVVGQRSFSKSCLEMAKPKGSDSPEALFITHLLDPVPTEIHVFNVFATGLPIYVGAQDGRVYAVEVSGGQPRARIVQHMRNMTR